MASEGKTLAITNWVQTVTMQEVNAPEGCAYAGVTSLGEGWSVAGMGFAGVSGLQAFSAFSSRN
jgi:hypothetical protein